MSRNRRGYMLVEVLLAISALVAIFGVCVALLHGLLKLDRGSRAHLAESVSRDRLARQFRIDVRAASGSRPGRDQAAPADHLQLSLPGGKAINYQMIKGSLVRQEHDENGRPARRESYRLPSHATPQFQVHQENQAVFIRLRLRSEPEAYPTRAPREFGFEAQLGKDLRLASVRETPR